MDGRRMMMAVTEYGCTHMHIYNGLNIDTLQHVEDVGQYRKVHSDPVIFKKSYGQDRFSHTHDVSLILNPISGDMTCTHTRLCTSGNCQFRPRVNVYVRSPEEERK